MKTCTQCEETKSKSDFYKGKAECKLCWNARSKAYHDSRPGYNAAKAAKWRVENPEKQKITMARAKLRLILNTPEKYLASQAASAARACGEITATPCEMCEAEKVVGHHTSYKKKHWLRVMWLCTLCHAEWHRKHEYNPKRKKYYVK